MSLSARLARIETHSASKARVVEIVAVDEADADRQILDALLGGGPGPISVTVTIGGQVVLKETWNVLSHEERLEQLM